MPSSVPPPPHQQALARVGTWLRGKWHLDRLLDTGGMASVYAGTHRNGQRAAIKVLHGALRGSTDLEQRFLREGYVANRVKHPNAVAVLDDDVAEDGAIYLVMELLEGESLEARLRRLGPITPNEALFVADQVLSVLAVAHAEGIIHRDIKPANLFLTREGIIKVLDFGLARVREVSFDEKQTRDGVVMGTAGYMSPEQARGLREWIDPRTDVWGVGSSMFMALSGHYVHEEGQTMMDRIVACASTPARSLVSVAPHLPVSLVFLVDHALAFLRENRWDDANAMRAAVQTVFVELNRREGARHHVAVPAPRKAFPQIDDVAPVEVTFEDDAHAFGASVVLDHAGDDMKLSFTTEMGDSILDIGDVAEHMSDAPLIEPHPSEPAVEVSGSMIEEVDDALHRLRRGK